MNISLSSDLSKNPKKLIEMETLRFFIFIFILFFWDRRPTANAKMNKTKRKNPHAHTEGERAPRAWEHRHDRDNDPHKLLDSKLEWEI